MINRKDVEKLAKLSALALSDEETDMFYKDMKSIVEFAGQIDNDYVDSEYLPEDNVILLREDIIKGSYPREEILKNAPTSHDGFFKLPRRNV